VAVVFSTSGDVKNPVHPEKAEEPTLLTELGMKRSSARPVQLRKALVPIEVREVGSDIPPNALKLIRLEHDWNAEFPTLVTRGMKTVSTLVHEKKASTATCVARGNQTKSMLEHELKAKSGK
jgi:hypothetical protein